jgi:hypothetical protein
VEVLARKNSAARARTTEPATNALSMIASRVWRIPGTIVGDSALSGCEEWFAEPLQAISGEAVFRRLSRSRCGPYRAGMLEHINIVLRVRPTQMRGIRNLFNGQRVTEIARFGQDAEDPEYD